MYQPEFLLNKINHDLKINEVYFLLMPKQGILVRILSTQLAFQYLRIEFYKCCLFCLHSLNCKILPTAFVLNSIFNHN